MNPYAVNLHRLVLAEEEGDSNAVIACKALLRIFRDKNGISDEMSWEDIDLVNSLESPCTSALEELAERGALIDIGDICEVRVHRPRQQDDGLVWCPTCGRDSDYRKIKEIK